MARKDGFYKVRHHGEEIVMKWTTTNDDNTHDIAGYWKGPHGYRGNDHDMDFISEKLIPDEEILKLSNSK